MSETEKQDWSRAAGGARRVSAWLRSLANQAVANSAGGGNQDAVEAPEAALPTEPEKKVGLKVVAAKCARWNHHRPGVYCGSCGKVN